MGISKYENFKEVLSKYNRKKNTPRRSITTEEKLALTLRLVHIPYNTPSPPSSKQLNKSQNAAVFWLTTFVNVRVVAGRSRTWAGPHRPSRDDDVNSHKPCRAHAVPLPCCVVAFRSRL